MDLKIVYKSVSELTPYENNPRNNDAAVDAVAESIQSFGFKVPIVIDGAGVIAAGHTRLKAAKKLGIEKVPCVIAEDLTEEQIKEFRIIDNRTNEIATWDFDKLKLEMQSLPKVNFKTFGFGGEASEKSGDDFFNRENRNDDSREAGNDEYNAFLDKFEEPKTTDDCYTPDNIYQIIADWTAKTYDVKQKNFVRPFYPGGDYKSFQYASDAVVVDNPPFSILEEIISFYIERGIRFLLFAPGLVSVRKAPSKRLCWISSGTGVRYENGAVVNTAFLTNLDDEYVVRLDPKLAADIKAANDKNRKDQVKETQKYEFPPEVLHGAKLNTLAAHGHELRIRHEDAIGISALDEMKDEDRAIFGGGLLLSEKATADRIAAEKAFVKRQSEEKKSRTWKLSKRELDIVHNLGKAKG